jgi:tRNA A37 N6-isopentenylltransferase MiaA
MTKKILAVVGPTGSGKTSLAIKLAKKCDGIIISADSRQIYRGLDIGTNKEGEPITWMGFAGRELKGIPQLLIDIVEPGERFTLHDWLKNARKAVETIHKQGKIPIIAGGTGLYVSALVSGYQLGSGRNAKNNHPVDFEYLILEIDRPREELYEKSDARYKRIFSKLYKEFLGLIERGTKPEWLEKIGLDYRYAFYYHTHQATQEETIRLANFRSHAYIRRQLTWWRHHEPTKRVENFEQAWKEAKKFLS